MKRIEDIVLEEFDNHAKYVKHFQNTSYTSWLASDPDSVILKYKIGEFVTGFFTLFNDFKNGKIIDTCSSTIPPRYKILLDDNRKIWTDEVYPFE